MKDIIKFSDDLTTDKETSRDKQEIELFFIMMRYIHYRNLQKS